jgi:DTW domain-containing protein YfiP
MRSQTPYDLAGHCPRCFLRTEICLCAEIERVDSPTEIVIVRHVVEARLTSNTGRLVALAVENCRIVDYNGGPDFDHPLLRGADTWLLYPGPTGRPWPERPARLVVLDGTFHQARHMYKRIAALRTMPELALPVPEAAPLRLRRPPRADGLSTLEAVAAAIGRLGRSDTADRLLALQETLVRRSRALRGWSP